MSNDTTTAANASQNASQGDQKKRTRTASKSKGYTVPDIARAYLKARGNAAPSDAAILKAGKVVRGIIRAHKGTLAKSDAAIKRHTKGADYGTLNKSTRDAVVRNTWKD